mmetsp:Transcript_65687/g.182831  ORF Transcript_65687/g.182831 Transcript_65687/m.182831 type:complete len:405 (-) Transcript_65687:519-1733(-)
MGCPQRLALHCAGRLPLNRPPMSGLPQGRLPLRRVGRACRVHGLPLRHLRRVDLLGRHGSLRLPLVLLLLRGVECNLLDLLALGPFSRPCRPRCAWWRRLSQGGFRHFLRHRRHRGRDLVGAHAARGVGFQELLDEVGQRGRGRRVVHHNGRGREALALVAAPGLGCRHRAQACRAARGARVGRAGPLQLPKYGGLFGRHRWRVHEAQLLGAAPSLERHVQAETDGRARGARPVALGWRLWSRGLGLDRAFTSAPAQRRDQEFLGHLRATPDVGLVRAVRAGPIAAATRRAVAMVGATDRRRREQTPQEPVAAMSFGGHEVKISVLLQWLLAHGARHHARSLRPLGAKLIPLVRLAPLGQAVAADEVRAARERGAAAHDVHADLAHELPGHLGILPARLQKLAA